MERSKSTKERLNKGLTSLKRLLKETKFHPLNFMVPTKITPLERNLKNDDSSFYKFYSESQSRWLLLRISFSQVEGLEDAKVEAELRKCNWLLSPENSFSYEANGVIQYYSIYSIQEEFTFLSKLLEQRDSDK